MSNIEKTSTATAVLKAYAKDKLDFVSKITDYKAVIFGSFRVYGIGSASCYYSGSGDSGQVDGVYAFPIGIDPDSEPSKAMPWPDACVMLDGIEVELCRAIENVAWFIIEHTEGGFENNEGGEGTLIFDAPENKIAWDHKEFYMSSNETSYEY